MNYFTLNLLSIFLIITAIWLFYLAKSRREKIEFTYEESRKEWFFFRTTYWTVIRSYIYKNFKAFIISSIVFTVLVILGFYYFYGESILGLTIAIALGVWGSILAGFYLGSTGVTILNVSSNTKDVFNIIKETVETLKDFFVEDKSEPKFYSGYVELPEKFYVNEAEKIEIYLEGNIQILETNRERLLVSQIEELKKVDIQIIKGGDKTEFLKIELQAASLKIGGEASQQINLVNNILKYHWSISSDKPTLHKLSLIFSKISNSNIKYLGELDHTIKVVNLLGLSRRQVFFGSAILGTLALIPAIIKLIEFLVF